MTLDFVARQLARVQVDMGAMRDDMAVLLAIVQRLDPGVSGFANELRAVHAKQDRQARAVRALEDSLQK